MRDLTDVGYASCSAKLMPKDSVLFSSRAPIGYVAIAENDICTNQGFKSFVFNKKVHPVYAYYYLKHIKKIAEQMSSGTTFKELSGAKAKALPFIVTHIEEQNQIATKLDELLAQVDNIKTRLENIPAILNQFKKSVLKSAMTGELTFDWREENHTSCVKNTIENIQCYREICLGKNAKFQKHLISEEYNIPESWKWVSLDFISKKIVDGTHHTPDYCEAGIPFISVKDIKDGKIDFTATKFISNQQHETLIQRCNPEQGDLLITKSGTIGRTAIIDTNKKFSLFVSVALVKPINKEINMQYIDLALQKWINSIDISNRIVGTAIKNLHLRDMRVLAIPFAPLEEQKEIVKRVYRLFAFADNIENRIKNIQSNIEPLHQSILYSAFSGKLTEKWREMNPSLSEA